eukprot:12428593-Karenia_brevis.AAC.1
MVLLVFEVLLFHATDNRGLTGLLYSNHGLPWPYKNSVIQATDYRGRTGMYHSSHRLPWAYRSIYYPYHGLPWPY